VTLLRVLSTRSRLTFRLPVYKRAKRKKKQKTKRKRREKGEKREEKKKNKGRRFPARRSHFPPTLLMKILIPYPSTFPLLEGGAAGPF
jgi:hypothetical protein